MIISLFSAFDNTSVTPVSLTSKSFIIELSLIYILISPVNMLCNHHKLNNYKCDAKDLHATDVRNTFVYS